MYTLIHLKFEYFGKSFFIVNSTKSDDMKDLNFCMYEFCTHLTLDPEIEKKVLYLLWAMLFLSTLEGLLEKYFRCMPRNIFVDSIPKIRLRPKRGLPLGKKAS